jgi:hypothetical protein
VTAPLVVCGDPGPRWFGLAVRRADDYLGHELLRRRSKGPLPERAYAEFLIARVRATRAAAARLTGQEPLLAFEVARGSTGFKRGEGAALRPVDVFGLGLVLGALLAAFPDAIEIPPGGNGSGLLACYPRELVGPRERGLTGTGRLRHCRSAWDAAAQAARRPALQAALDATTTAARTDATVGEPADVVAQGGLVAPTTSLTLIHPARRQRHDRTQPEGGDAA